MEHYKVKLNILVIPYKNQVDIRSALKSGAIDCIFQFLLDLK